MEGRRFLSAMPHILHVIASAPHHFSSEFERLVVFDEILDSLAENSLLRSCVLSPAVLPIEHYLSLRPERFDQIVAYAAQGRLEIGAWYTEPGAQLDNLELTIRSLLLGKATLQVLGITPRLAPFPTPQHLSHQLELVTDQFPQILAGFGISVGIRTGRNTESDVPSVMGLDGTSLAMLYTFPAEVATSQVIRQPNYVVDIEGMPADWEGGLKQLRAALPKTEVVFSTWGAAAKLIKPELPQPEDHKAAAPTLQAQMTGFDGVQKMLITYVEPLCVWAAYDVPDARLKQPQRILQHLWREVFKTQPQTKGILLDQVEHFAALYPVSPEDMIAFLCHVEAEAFSITAIKLREDGEEGIIVRGYNPTGKAHWVSLRLWREFAHCDVVRLDESRTGGSLPIAGGEIKFMANPHRITTLWLR